MQGNLCVICAEGLLYNLISILTLGLYCTMYLNIHKYCLNILLPPDSLVEWPFLINHHYLLALHAERMLSFENAVILLL